MSEDVFELRDEFLRQHPEMGAMFHLCEWYAWAERQMRPARIYELRYRDGQLVSRRDVTPDDPEPSLNHSHLKRP